MSTTATEQEALDVAVQLAYLTRLRGRLAAIEAERLPLLADRDDVVADLRAAGVSLGRIAQAAGLCKQTIALREQGGFVPTAAQRSRRPRAAR